MGCLSHDKALRGSTAWVTCLCVMLWECRVCRACSVCLSRDLSDSSPPGPFLSVHHHSLGSESSGTPASRERLGSITYELYRVISGPLEPWI